MRIMLPYKIFTGFVLTLFLLGLSQCGTDSTSASGWEQLNGELIKKYDLKARSLTGLPESTIASNLEPAKVKDLHQLDSISLYPGVNANLFWGSGTMISILNLQPNTKIPGETLASDRLLFV